MMAATPSSSNETSIPEDEHAYTTSSSTSGKFFERNPAHFCDCPSCLGIPFHEWGATYEELLDDIFATLPLTLWMNQSSNFIILVELLSQLPIWNYLKGLHLQCLIWMWSRLVSRPYLREPERTLHTALESGMSGPKVESNKALKFNLLWQWMTLPSNTGSHTSF